jgi:hypothetical protein
MERVHGCFFGLIFVRVGSQEREALRRGVAIREMPEVRLACRRASRDVRHASLAWVCAGGLLDLESPSGVLAGYVWKKRMRRTPRQVLPAWFVRHACVRALGNVLRGFASTLQPPATHDFDPATRPSIQKHGSIAYERAGRVSCRSNGSAASREFRVEVCWAAPGWESLDPWGGVAGQKLGGAGIGFLWRARSQWRADDFRADGGFLSSSRSARFLTGATSCAHPRSSGSSGSC